MDIFFLEVFFQFHFMILRLYFKYLVVKLKTFFTSEPNMKLKMRIQLINAAGLDEAGIDGGGIFREFLSELLKTGFDPNRGLFQYTNDRLLYPNPHANFAVEDFTKHYFFLGRMLGKVAQHLCLVVEVVYQLRNIDTMFNTTWHNCSRSWCWHLTYSQLKLHWPTNKGHIDRALMDAV